MVRRAFSDVQDDGGAFCGAFRAFYALRLGSVGGLSETRRVGEGYFQVLVNKGNFHRIARSTVSVGYDGAFLAREGVQKTAFPDVGRAHDCDVSAVFDKSAQPYRFDKRVDFSFCAGNFYCLFRDGGSFKLLFGVVESGFYGRFRVAERVEELFNLFAQLVLREHGGCASRSFRFGVNQVDYALRVGKILLAVDKRAL